LIRILLADDQALIRSGIRSLLEAEDDIEATRQMVADERLECVRVVILTNFELDEYIFRALRAGARPPDAIAAVGMERLTNREREVVALVAHGLSNDEIADAMVLSPATAKTHVSRAMTKLGARDRAQLVVFAYQAGLVTPRSAGPALLPGAARPAPAPLPSPSGSARPPRPTLRTLPSRSGSRQGSAGTPRPPGSAAWRAAAPPAVHGLRARRSRPALWRLRPAHRRMPRNLGSPG